jgi:hypothetical protein
MAKNGRTEAAVALSPLLTSAAMEALRRYADLPPEMAVPNRYQAKAELHFTFGALAVESHFMPAFSQADWFLGGGVVKPTARMRVRIVTKPFMARLLRLC